MATVLIKHDFSRHWNNFRAFFSLPNCSLRVNKMFSSSCFSHAVSRRLVFASYSFGLICMIVEVWEWQKQQMEFRSDSQTVCKEGRHEMTREPSQKWGKSISLLPFIVTLGSTLTWSFLFGAELMCAGSWSTALFPPGGILVISDNTKWKPKYGWDMSLTIF